MNSSNIFWPVLALVFLTLIMYIVLGARRAKAVKAGKVNRQQAALDNKVWPEDVIQVSNNITNQFEAPTLFYVLSLVLYTINAAGTVAVTLAWLFVLSRYAHAYVHVSSNNIPMRLGLFLFGYLVLLVMLLMAAWKLFPGAL
ncbi:MAPEG family protein [Nitrincola alkalilacustris]|uniref:MAPEG family protein n=1 Tax=Nitrincola alkalilacustris TaxID=1571224 RepID=UPI00124F5A36|nr:MAPEG family protein [Nitrincola alkalilacustris]